MTKPPVVYVTGMMRALRQFITGEQWTWLCDGAGQRLYYPPDVSGWDDKRWLDSNTIRGRWDCVNYAVEGRTIYPGSDEAYALSGRDAGAGGRRRARVLAGPEPDLGDRRFAARARACVPACR